MISLCLNCNKQFTSPSPSHIRKGKGKYCSVQCRDVIRKKRTENKLESIIELYDSGLSENGVSKKLGISRGTVEYYLVKRKKHKVRTRSEAVSDEKHWAWKGNKCGYVSLHHWLYRKLGKAKKCEYCGSVERVQWANKSHEYKRELQDWIELCQGCHSIYDHENGWGVVKLRFANI